MIVHYLVTADYVNVDAYGRPMAVGIFSVITPPTLPTPITIGLLAECGPPFGATPLGGHVRITGPLPEPVTLPVTIAPPAFSDRPVTLLLAMPVVLVRYGVLQVELALADGTTATRAVPVVAAPEAAHGA